MVNGKEKGFTLIEMLVVIAVVGILSATVLTALSPSRKRAQDSRIVTGMQQIRAVAETRYNGSTGMYEIDGTSDADITRQMDDIEQNGGTDFVVETTDEGRAYRSYVVLPGSGKFYCIDSTGFSGEQNDEPVASGVSCSD